LAKHFDDREIVVVQLHGRKRWRVAPNREAPYPTAGYPTHSADHRARFELSLYAPDVFALEMPADAMSFELVPGSVLFLPRGAWHETHAVTDSLSLTVGLALPTTLNALVAALYSHLLPDAEWRRPMPLGASARCRADYRQRLRTLLSSEPPWSAVSVDELLQPLNRGEPT
jgi:50S ribosomal protein L16 3-hydroxylase